MKALAEIMHGRIIGQTVDKQPTHLLLDSRKLIFPDSTVFFAISGSHHTGITYIQNLYEKKVRCFVIDDSGFNITRYPDATFILVEKVLPALQLLAAHHRSLFTLPVTGITGSNGKTIVKEWLYQLLSDDLSIVRSPKSYNSQVGVPLSVLQLESKHSLALFEAGISETGEMVTLEKMIRPTAGIFTNIGEAHSEGFKNKQQKIQEKLKLFEHAALLTFCADDAEVKDAAMQLKEKNPGLVLFTWGHSDTDTLQVVKVQKHNGKSAILAIYEKKQLQVTIPFTDDASVENAITCWCVLLQMNIESALIESRMTRLHPVEMRLQLKQGINNCSVINDSYSSDINSLQIALDFLQQQKQHTKHTVVLSDILQSGKDEDDLYKEVAFLLKQKRVTRLIAVGPRLYMHQALFSFLGEKYFYSTVEAFTAQFHSLQFRDETILLKGARRFEFEQIDHLLEQKVHQTILSINLTSIAHNLKHFRSLVPPKVKLMAMVKAFSYGSGSYEIASLLQFNHVDYLAVAYADEGVDLRKAGITMPIMVMNPEENTFNALVQYHLEPEVFSFPLLAALEAYLASLAIQHFPIHLKLDTGMHRLGFGAEDIGNLANRLTNNHLIKVQSVFSHLAASDDERCDDFTRKQVAVFTTCSEKLKAVLPYPFLRHIANTAAIRNPLLQMDMIRLGIGLYGIAGQESIQKKLKNVSALTTTIAQVKKVKAGEHVGYGCHTVLEKDAVIATVRIGYADGYPRALSNGVGKMLVQNNLAPVVGSVCMDMTMLDVTGIPCTEGATVTVFGEQLPITRVAEWCHTIPYEIMTGVSQRVKRVYFEE